jgi:Putative beta-barrel porin-2, OmpL-like. bbp2
MRIYRLTVGIISVAMLAVSGVAIADDAAPAAAADAAAAKPAVPSLADILDGSGITLTGYVDGTFAYQHNDTSKQDYNTFALQQASFTLAKQPTSGFGALVQVIAGQNPYAATGFGSIPPGQGATTTGFYLLQAFAQYVSGPLTLQVGKFNTLAGAEVAQVTSNTNTTRSILFAFEPVTHTGVRATYAASDTVNVIVGVTNGWTNSQDTADASDKTVEAGVSFTPSKALAWTLQGYYGRDTNNYGVKGNVGLFDTVLTWNASSALSLVGSVDYGRAESTTATPSASWWGAAAYVNYAINDLWRVSLRGEYYDDQKGYLTKNFDPVTFAGGVSQKLKEVTVTFGYDPTKNFEFRVEGRYDDPDTIGGVRLVPQAYQGWFEAMYKF